MHTQNMCYVGRSLVLGLILFFVACNPEPEDASVPESKETAEAAAPKAEAKREAEEAAKRKEAEEAAKREAEEAAKREAEEAAKRKEAEEAAMREEDDRSMLGDLIEGPEKREERPEEYEDDSEENFYLGEEAKEDEELDRAIDYYQQVRPGSSSSRYYIKAQNSLGRIYLEMKDYEKAVESFNNALEQNPYGYAAHLNMALALYHLGELEYYTEARKHLDEVVRLRSHIPSQIATKIELKTLYLKGLCLYGEFEIASGGRKQQKGVRAHQALKRFTNRVSSEDEIFADQREDAEAKIDAIEQQIY